MVQPQGIGVRRAKVSDAGSIARFVSHAWQERLGVDEQAVIERLGSVGFLLAERGDKLVGMLGWQAENLVVRVTDFLIWPACERRTVGQALLSRMEQSAGELQCEAALLVLPHPIPPSVLQFCETLGYEAQTLQSLPEAWREAGREARLDDDQTVLMKQLRASRVGRPL